MYVVHRSLHPLRTISNLEVATVRHFQDRPRIPTMSNKILINRNARAGELHFEEYLHLTFA
jgi:hypothetical protein